MKISAVIITRDEARNIKDCIQSLASICDDIVVLDTGSNDKTCEIAKQCGARVESIEWRGYTASKNHANGLAVNDWVLSIDADERLSDELAHSIGTLKPQPNTVYQLDRFTNYCGHWVRFCGWYPEWKARLFDRREIVWQGDYVHEALEIPNRFKQQKLEGKLLHFSYYSVEEHVQRLQRYAELSAQQMHARGKRVSRLRPTVSAAWRFFSTAVFQPSSSSARQFFSPVVFSPPSLNLAAVGRHHF
ncbi:MAG: glycosyltransferase family 2 protein, partial [Pseudomonadota bacterium]